MMACDAECQYLPEYAADSVFRKPGPKRGMVHPLASCMRVRIVFSTHISRLQSGLTKVVLKSLRELA
jgi:hypothetical protein